MARYIHDNIEIIGAGWWRKCFFKDPHFRGDTLKCRICGEKIMLNAPIEQKACLISCSTCKKMMIYVK